MQESYGIWFIFNNPIIYAVAHGATNKKYSVDFQEMKSTIRQQ